MAREFETDFLRLAEHSTDASHRKVSAWLLRSHDKVERCGCPRVCFFAADNACMLARTFIVYAGEQP